MNILRLIALLFVFSVVVLYGCNSDTKKNNKREVEKSLDVELDTTAQMIKFENTLFSLPSPYQLSILIKELGASYNSELINPSANYSNYTSIFKKSINLGIYGADLAYLNIYEQSPSAIKYFSVIKIISQDLGLSAAITPNIFERIEGNVDNQDSLMYIMSSTYRDVDLFLKENQRQREGALVLAGGWIEAMYFITKIAIETNNEKMIERIGENKQPLENLIKILSPYYSESGEVARLIDDLLLLASDFDAINTEYTFIEPTTDAKNQITHVHSESRVVVSAKALKSIDKKITNIRTELIK